MALAHVVARQRERLLARVPHGEGKIADQMVDAIGAPSFVRCKQQRAVRRVGKRRGADRQRLGKLLAIVEPQIGNECQPGIMERLGVGYVLAGDEHHQVAETNRSGRPCPRAVGTEVREPRYLAIKIASRNRLAVEIEIFRRCRS